MTSARSSYSCDAPFPKPAAALGSAMSLASRKPRGIQQVLCCYLASERIKRETEAQSGKGVTSVSLSVP